MSWITQTFSSSIGKKVIMSLTGLFLITFLIVHVSGNLLLFRNDGGEAFNEYAQFMTSNTLIRIISIVLYAAIIAHVIWSLILSAKNRQARPVGYETKHPASNSTWRSRNMGILGTIILIFLIIHLRSFWYELKFGHVPMAEYEGVGKVEDLSKIVKEAFSQWWYALIYVFAMVGLAFHLSHGFYSAFRTLGLGHKKYIPIIKTIGVAFAVIISALFASMPIYFFFENLG